MNFMEAMGTGKQVKSLNGYLYLSGTDIRFHSIKEIIDYTICIGFLQ